MTGGVEEIYARWEARQRDRVIELITRELIEEHRATLGDNASENLQRVLQYFRRQPTAGKYVGVMTRPWSEYRIGVLPGVWGRPVRILDGETYSTEDELVHAIFLRRIRELNEEKAP